MHDRKPASTGATGMTFVGFVALIAALMATTALAVDAMLPALPQIGTALGIADDNQRQWVVTSYMLGFGGVQIFIGPLADRFGRKPLMLGGLALYAVAALAAAASGTFTTMMIARALQGMGAAAPRVLAATVVRDNASGRDMARIMSLAMMTFLAVPILAPSIGQLVLFVASWRAIFALFTFVAAAVFVWTFLALPETLRAENRSALDARTIARNMAACFRERTALGYMLATACAMGGLLAFINCVQQICVDVFQAGPWLPLMMAVVGSSMAAASLFNSRIVGRMGMRVTSHAASFAFLAGGVLQIALAASGHESIVAFTLVQCFIMFCFGFMVPNFGAMSMEPLGRLAGTGSAVQGFTTTILGSLIGFAIGQEFDGTLLPYGIGVTLCAGGVIGAALIAEQGRLFRVHQR